MQYFLSDILHNRPVKVYTYDQSLDMVMEELATLFHFTKIEGLQGILRSMGFYCQYSDEHFENILPQSSSYRFCYVPMTSFLRSHYHATMQ